MRVFSYFLILVLFLLSIVFALFETPIGGAILSKMIKNRLAQSGIQISVGSIRGTLPSEIQADQVQIQTEIGLISIESIRVKIEPTALLKQEIVIDHLQATGISLPQNLSATTFSADGKYRLYTQNGHMRFQGTIFIDELPPFTIDLAIAHKQGSLHMKTDDIIALRASIGFQQTDLGLQIQAKGSIPHLQYKTLSFDHTNISCSGLWSQGIFTGNSAIETSAFKEQWTLNTSLAYQSSVLNLQNIHLQSPSFLATGNGSFQPASPFIGIFHIEKGQLQLLQKAYPHLPLYGAASGNCSFDQQGMQADLTISELYMDNAYAETVHVQCTYNYDHTGFANAHMLRAKYKKLFLDETSLTAESANGVWPFHFTTQGTMKDPMQLDLDGIGTFSDNQNTIQITNASGRMLHYPIALETPVKIGQENEFFICENLRCKVGLATIAFDFKGQPQDTAATLVLNQMPLDFLSLNPLELTVSGKINMTADLIEKGKDIATHAAISLNNIRIKTPGEEIPMLAEGIVNAAVQDGRLALDGKLQTGTTALANLNLDLPVELQLWPFQSFFPPQKQIRGQIRIDGRIEEVLNFFDLGAHRLEGNCKCDLTLNNTLANPRLTGQCRFQDGLYENYITGTELYDIQAQVLADKNQLKLIDLTAHGANQKGQLQAQGKLLLAKAKNFPFHLDIDFSQLNIVQLALVAAEAEGHIAVTGNLQEGSARGEITIAQAEMSVPNKLPSTLPDLQVVYKNAPKPIEHTFPASQTITYPLTLDLKVHAPRGIYVEGRGLNSEWKGDFHLGGTYNSVAPQGKLELLTGELSFAGHNFKLSEGSVAFSGKHKEMPFLDIAAS